MDLNSIKLKYDRFLDEKFIPLDKRNKFFLLAALLILPVVLFYLVFLGPNFAKIEESTDTLTSAQAELQKLRKTSQDLPKHKKELEETREDFALTSILLPKSQEIPNLLRDISDLGQNSGLDFLSFVPGKETPKDFYAEIPIDIKIKGPYHNLGLFLDRVSKLDRIVTVNNIKIENAEQSGSRMLLTSTCQLVTYRFTNVKLQPPSEKK
ncbi:MAG: type 4a pilus biogenesis protein PilO [Desulfobulbus sp.]|jgi:type IV pilus assembly protein PilO